MSPKHQSVEILTKPAKGVGGVAKSSDMEITLAITGITASGLIGRAAKVFIGSGSALSESANCILSGSVFDIDKSKNSLSFNIRGNSQLWDAEIGQLSGSTNDLYKSKITPITYGDFSDSAGFMPMVLTDEFSNSPQLKTSARELSEITDVVCWDEEGKVAYQAFHGSNIVISADNTILTLAASSDVKVVEATGTVSSIKIWNPRKVIMSLDGEPSLDTTSVYHITGDSDPFHKFRFIEVSGGFYIFAVVRDWTTLGGVSSGELTKDSGTGDATIDFTWISNPQPDSFYLEGAFEEYPDVTDSLIGIIPKPCVIKIDSEQILVHYMVDRTDSDVGYEYTECLCVRGYNGSTSANHAIDAPVFYSDQVTGSKWLVKHTFFPSDLSGITFLTFSKPGVELWYSDYARYTDFSTLGNLVAAYKNKLILPQKYSGALDDYEATITLDAAGAADDSLIGDALLLIGLVFPKISVQGDIAAMYMQGSYNVIATNVGDYQLGIGISVGPRPIPQFVDSSDDADVLGTCGSYRKKPWNSEEVTLIEEGGLANRSVVFGLQDKIISLDAARGWDDEDTFTLDHSDLKRNGLLSKLDELNTQRITLACLGSWQYSKPIGKVVWNIAAPGILIYFYVDPTKNVFWARGKGVVDGTSTLIENPVYVIKDLLSEEGVVPVGSIETPASSISERAGWKVALSLHEDPVQAQEVLEQISREHGLIIMETNSGELSIKTLDIPSRASVDHLINNYNILGDGSEISWVESYTSTDYLITEIEAKYKKRLTDKVYTATEADTYTVESLDLDRKAVLSLETIRDRTTVQNLLGLMESYYTQPMRVGELVVDLSKWEIEVGDWVGLTSDTYIPNVSTKVFLVLETELTPPCLDNEPGLKLTLLEVPT
jgi:hypothetical protein